MSTSIRENATNAAVAQIDTSIQQHATTAEDMSATAEDILHEADRLEELMQIVLADNDADCDPDGPCSGQD